MPNDKNFANLVKDWAIEEGVMSIKLPEDPKIAFGFELKFPPNAPHPKKIILFSPKHKDFLIYQLGTQLSPPHQDIMRKAPIVNKNKFFLEMKKFFSLSNLLYNLDVQNNRWAISDQLFFDGLTKDSFLRTLRKVFNGSHYVDLLLREHILEGKEVEGEGQDTPGSSMYM